MLRHRKAVLLSVAALALAALAYALLNRPDAGAGAGAYETQAVERGDVERSVAATGAVRPLVIIELGSELSGQIAELHADFNDEVKAGQVVALIDPRTFAARVEQAEADLALAEASLTSAEAAIVRAEANLAKAERDYERSLRLSEQGNVSESALDIARTALKVAQADLSTAQAQKVTAQATIAQRRAALSQARIDLERTRIRSPIDGVIVNRVVDVGQTVAASLSAPILFEIAQDLRSIQIEASVDEADIGEVHPGNPVRFTVDAYRERTFEGRVRQVRLAPVELQNVVTYTVIIDAANPDRSLLPGMTANLEIVTGSRENVLRIPNEALRFRPPQEVAAAAEQPRSGPGGPAGAGLEALAGRLDLDESQVARLRESLAQMRSAFRAGPGGGADGVDPALMRQRFQARMERALADVLTPGQMERYRAMQSGQGGARAATVWVPGADGGIVPRRVLLGLGDNRFTEILRGLEEGDRVVTRTRIDSDA